MAFTLDRSTSIGKVRSLIGDTVEQRHFLEDEDIQVFLDQQSNDLQLAAADALEAMAVRVALVVGKVNLFNLQQDGTAVAKVLMDLARTFREQAGQGSEWGLAGNEETFNPWDRYFVTLESY
jgi:glycogen synthase